MQKPLVYLILGTPGSGRRKILADLQAESFGPEENIATLVSESEPPSDADAALRQVQRWSFSADKHIHATAPEDASTVFFIADGRANPVDQLEDFRRWISKNNLELGRIVCVVDCSIPHKHEASLAWFDACIHFSDVVLLNRRENIPNKWMGDFIDRYEAQCFPCVFELVKKDKVRNPALVLDPLARRISQAFEEIPEGSFHSEDWGDADTEFIDDEEDKDLEGGRSPEDEDEHPEEDPYFVRKPGGGRVRHIPDINQFLA